MGEPSAEKTVQRARLALFRLHHWVLENGWAGYDPYDVNGWWLSLPGWLRRLTIVGKRPSRWPVGLSKRFPRLARRLFRVPRKVWPKAMGLFTQAYVSLYERFGAAEYLALAKETAQWLLNRASPEYQGYGWGLPIDWQSRILIPRATPCGIVSVICGEGFWRLYAVTGEVQYLDACRLVCEGFLQGLNIDRIDPEAICFSFTPLDHFHVHNPNLWIAAFLVKVGQELDEDEYIARGLEASNYALKEQQEDGCVQYWGSDQDTTGAIDHYHSGFKIRAFHSLWRLTGEAKFDAAARQFHDYYQKHFIGPNGEPWRNPDDASVIDIHGCAEALICNAQLAGDMPRARELLERTAHWTIENMQSPRGYFIYRILRDVGRERRIDIPYIRWGQAWMMRGLTAVLEALGQPTGAGAVV